MRCRDFEYRLPGAVESKINKSIMNRHLTKSDLYSEKHIY